MVNFASLFYSAGHGVSFLSWLNELGVTFIPGCSDGCELIVWVITVNQWVCWQKHHPVWQIALFYFFYFRHSCFSWPPNNQLLLYLHDPAWCLIQLSTTPAAPLVSTEHPVGLLSCDCTVFLSRGHIFRTQQVERSVKPTRRWWWWTYSEQSTELRSQLFPSGLRSRPNRKEWPLETWLEVINVFITSFIWGFYVAH